MVFILLGFHGGEIQHVQPCGVKKNLNWILTVIHRSMCSLSRAIMNNGRLIYTALHTTLNCMIILVLQCSIKLQISTQDYFVSLLRIPLAGLQRGLLNHCSWKTEGQKQINSIPRPVMRPCSVVQRVVALRLVHINCADELVQVASLSSSAHDHSQNPKRMKVGQSGEKHIFSIQGTFGLLVMWLLLLLQYHLPAVCERACVCGRGVPGINRAQTPLPCVKAPRWDSQLSDCQWIN